MSRQRLTTAMVLVAMLLGAPGLAAGSSPPPLTLVALVPGTGQAMIWDREAGIYRLLRAGERAGTIALHRLERQGALVSHRGEVLQLRLAPPPLGPDKASAPVTRPAGIVLARQAEAEDRSFDQVPGLTLPAPPDSAAAWPPGAREGSAAPASQGGEAVSATASSAADPAAPETPPRAAPVSPRGSTDTPTSPPRGRTVASTARASAAAETASSEEAQRRLRRVSLRLVREEVSAFLAGKVPYRGAFTGAGLLELSGIRQGSLLHAIGLRSGDQVIAVGGQPVSSSDTAMDAYLELYTQRQVEIVIKRDGQRRVLRLDLEA